MAEKALGTVRYGLAPSVKAMGTQRYRRSIFARRDIAAGEVFSLDNVQVVRPSDGLAPKHLEAVLGKTATQAIEMGTPLSWALIGS